MKIIIVGGVAGGASAAARARRLSEEAEILLIERGPDVSFANCGLPYYIGEQIQDRNKLLVTKPQLLRDRFRLDVRIRSEVKSIDRESRTVTITNLETVETYQESFDKLILAPGAAPFRPPIPGLDLSGIYTLRNLQDADRIYQALSRNVRRVVIIGGGFIGLEMVENMIGRGLEVTLVELQDQILPPSDKEMTHPLLKTLRKQEVRVILGDAAEKFSQSDDQLTVHLKSGEEIPAGLVVLGIGVKPENQLAVDAGLSVGPRGGIQVNEYLQTDDPDIFAVGDAIEVRDFVLDQPTQIPLAGPANRQGRIAADNLFGRQSTYRGTQGTSVVGLFGMTAAMTGASEKVLQKSDLDYRAIYLHPSHHAGYYPGAEQMTLKLLFEAETGKVLGAQAVGGRGVAKRIDVISVAIQAGMTVFDLEELELAYAPQYGSAKDPVNMAGFVASGIVRGDHPQITVGELLEQPDYFRLDVRTSAEFSAGHIEGAVNIPVDELRGRLHELPRDQTIVAYCKVGQRGYLATRILMQSGFDVHNLSGGFLAHELWNE